MANQLNDFNLQKDKFNNDKDDIYNTIDKKVKEKILIIENALTKSDLSENNRSYEQKLKKIDILNEKAENLINSVYENLDTNK